MTIPEAQLEAWSTRGALDGSENTYSSIKRALDTYPWLTRPSYEVYLQGSYRNYTNTRGNSDVDVVVELPTVYYAEISSLPELDLQRYNREFSQSTYSWFTFRNDVYSALSASYGGDRVKYGTKTLKVQSPYLPADVVVCCQHRWYWSYAGNGVGNYTEGMTFYIPSEARWVVNYPKDHYRNGNNKSRDTNQWYKQTVRVFKNMRYRLEDNRKLAPDTVSSYFIECLLYNAPSYLFGLSYERTVLGILKWLYSLDEAGLDALCCQNGLTKLCGYEREQWPKANARAFIRATIDMWNEWE